MKLNTLQNPVIPETVDSSNQPLTTGEEMRLSHLEKLITDSMQNVGRSLFDMGKALAEIRDDRLYRATGDSFEVYVFRRFEMSRSRAYQLISANDIRTSLAGVLDVKTETVAREIARVPKGERKSVAKALAKLEKEKPITQTVAKEIVDEIKQPPEGGLVNKALAKKAEEKANVHARGHVGPAKTKDILKPNADVLTRPEVQKMITDWWEANRAGLVIYANTPAEKIVQQIIALFA